MTIKKNEASQTPDLHPSQITIEKEDSEEIKKEKREIINSWSNEIVEQLHKIAEKYNVAEMVIAFTHPGTGMPTVTQSGDIYKIAKIMAGATRVLKSEINKTLET